jgi:hypothetical protein
MLFVLVVSDILLKGRFVGMDLVRACCPYWAGRNFLKVRRPGCAIHYPPRECMQNSNVWLVDSGVVKQEFPLSRLRVGEVRIGQDEQVRVDDFCKLTICTNV